MGFSFDLNTIGFSALASSSLSLVAKPSWLSPTRGLSVSIEAAMVERERKKNFRLCKTRRKCVRMKAFYWRSFWKGLIMVLGISSQKDKKLNV